MYYIISNFINYLYLAIFFFFFWKQWYGFFNFLMHLVIRQYPYTLYVNFKLIFIVKGGYIQRRVSAYILAFSCSFTMPWWWPTFRAETSRQVVYDCKAMCCVWLWLLIYTCTEFYKLFLRKLCEQQLAEENILLGEGGLYKKLKNKKLNFGVS